MRRMGLLILLGVLSPCIVSASMYKSPHLEELFNNDKYDVYIGYGDVNDEFPDYHCNMRVHFKQFTLFFTAIDFHIFDGLVLQDVMFNGGEDAKLSQSFTYVLDNNTVVESENTYEGLSAGFTIRPLKQTIESLRDAKLMHMYAHTPNTTDKYEDEIIDISDIDAPLDAFNRCIVAFNI